MRADGFEVFVPHEHELAMSDATPEWIFAKDMDGLGPANAVLALLDGPMVDDGTACEIGIFYALMQSDPAKKGVVGLLTDLRGSRGESSGLNLFVEGLHPGDRRRGRRLVRRRARCAPPRLRRA